MSQSNKGIVAVIAGGCVLGLGIGLGYLFYWAPKQKAEAAKEEIREWGNAWTEAKHCLLGKKPSSYDAREAITARELSTVHARDQLVICMQQLKGLPREMGASTENDAIEDAWLALNKPLGALNQAHMWKTAETPNKSQSELTEELADAIGNLDVAYGALRKAAKLEPQQTPDKRLATASKSLELAPPDPKVTSWSFEKVRVRQGTIDYQVGNEEATFTAVLGDSGTTAFHQLSPLALRAAEASWGLWIERDGVPVPETQTQKGDRIVTGPLDDLGEPAGDGVLLHTLADGEEAFLKFAVGAVDRFALTHHAKPTGDGYVEWEYRLLRSRTSGESWEPVALPDTELYVSLKRQQHGSYVSWSKGEASPILAYQELSLDGFGLNELDFGTPSGDFDHWPPERCYAERRTWWVADGRVFHMEPEGSLVEIPGRLQVDVRNFEQFMQCSDTGFAVTSTGYDERQKGRITAQSCSLDGCDSELRRIPAPTDAQHFAFFHEGEHAVVVTTGGVAALWLGDAEEPRLYSVGPDADVKGALSRGGAIELLLWGHAQSAPHLVSLPL